MIKFISSKLRPNKLVSESTPLLMSTGKNMEKEECFMGLIQEAKGMLEVMLKFEKLNAQLELDATKNTEMLISRSIEVSKNWKNKELEDVLSEMTRIFDNIKYKAKIIPISR